MSTKDSAQPDGPPCKSAILVAAAAPLLHYAAVYIANVTVLARICIVVTKGCKKEQFGNVLVFVQLIFYPGWSTNQMYSDV